MTTPPERPLLLLVEDDTAMAYVLRGRFAEAGIDLDHVEDGFLAIERLRTQNYDAVILDLIIHSGLNGFGVLNFIEMEKPQLLDCVFLISGMSEQTIVNTAPQLVPRFYRKPFDERQLVEVVRAVVRGPEPEAAPPDRRVLIVDDDPLMRHLLNTIVRRLGYTSEEAIDGREAIRKLSVERFDSVLLDLVMPGVDGFSVLDYLGKTQPGVLRKTIVTTGLPEKYRASMDSQSVCAVVEKPLDPKAIAALIARCAIS